MVRRIELSISRSTGSSGRSFSSSCSRLSVDRSAPIRIGMVLLSLLNHPLDQPQEIQCFRAGRCLELTQRQRSESVRCSKSGQSDLPRRDASRYQAGTRPGNQSGEPFSREVPDAETHRSLSLRNLMVCVRSPIRETVGVVSALRRWKHCLGRLQTCGAIRVAAIPSKLTCIETRTAFKRRAVRASAARAHANYRNASHRAQIQSKQRTA